MRMRTRMSYTVQAIITVRRYEWAIVVTLQANEP
jgi:hypothetical protein